MLIEIKFFDSINVGPSNEVFVREVTAIMDGLTEISRTYHRRVLIQGADITNEDARVKAVATAAWTGAPPPVPFPATPARVVTRIAFARLFTVAERIAIRTASESSRALQDFSELLNFADTVNLDHPDVLAGLTALTNAGLLANGRMARIIANQAPA